MLKPIGIFSTVNMRFSKSTKAAGLDFEVVTVDIPMSADSAMVSGTPTTNFSTATAFAVGEFSTSIRRSWIKPDFSSIPIGRRFLQATLKPVPVSDQSANDRTMRVHRCLRDVVNAQVTWNIWKISNNWASGGASSSGSDYDATEMGSGLIPASPTLNVPLEIDLAPELLQELYDGTYTNDGLILFVDTQDDDLIGYGSIENSTPSLRPVITIKYI